MENSNLLIILTGKTASGKDTVMAKLLSKIANLKKITTTTSRTPRPGEKNGIDYYFISEKEFKEKAQKGEFIEFVEYGGNFYGTEKAEIMNNFNQSLIWRIDPSRAGQAKKFIEESFEDNLAQDLLKRVIVIYLTVDNKVILERLNERGYSGQQIKARMQDDNNFWQQYKDDYDVIVENIPGKLDLTVDKILTVIQNQFKLP